MATLNEPSVCAIMLTRDRPDMAQRAVECFRRQTYQNKRLLIWDGGSDDIFFEDDDIDDVGHFKLKNHQGPFGKTIGDLRNEANAVTSTWRYPILIHWDDDDFSHPNRIAEQVALLQSSGADCVGYNEMLFWKNEHSTLCAFNVGRKCNCYPPSRQELESWGRLMPGVSRFVGESVADDNGAWLYSNPNPSYVLGTSMCYWRKAWEARPFEATSQGEDVRWSAGVRCVGSQSFWPRAEAGTIAHGSDSEPRMIARIHAGNTSNAYRPETMARASEWRRVPEWDQHCRSVFA